MDIMGLREVRWTILKKHKTTSGETILYFGAEVHP